MNRLVKQYIKESVKDWVLTVLFIWSVGFILWVGITEGNRPISSGSNYYNEPVLTENDLIVGELVKEADLENR